MPSQLVLGAMLFGTTVDESTSFALLDAFVEAGGEWIDTADCYAFWKSASGYGGDSERVIGRWLAARPGMRGRVKISTKLGAEPIEPGSAPKRVQGLSAAAIRAALDGSLDRLGVDSVDLLWLHQEDRSVPIEETVDALAAPLAAGTVARVGASNHPAWRIERARRHARDIGSRPIDALQLGFTYLLPRAGVNPMANVHPFSVFDDEQRDFARENGLDVWAYTPLLTGAYDNPRKAIPDAYDHPDSARRLAVLTELSRELGVERGQLVLAWLVGGDPAIRPILGGSKLDQLARALEALALELSPEQRARLDAPS